MTILLVLWRQVWQYKKRGQGCSSRPVLPLALPHRPHGRHRHTCHVSQVPVSSDQSGHAREINWHLKNDSENNVDRFARDENVYQGRADMLHFRLKFRPLFHSQLLLVSGRRPTAQKSITSSIVLKYPRSGHLFFTELYGRIDILHMSLIRALWWRSTGFLPARYMCSQTTNPTPSAPMTGMTSTSFRYMQSPPNNCSTWQCSRWLLCRQIIVPGLWCSSLSGWTGCGTAPRSPAGSSTLETSGSIKVYTSSILDWLRLFNIYAHKLWMDQGFSKVGKAVYIYLHYTPVPNTIPTFRFDNVTNFVTPELASLHDRQGNPLPLDELYLDTTFCSPLYKTFPTREEAQEEIWRLCKKWVTKGSLAWEKQQICPY